MSCIIEGAEKLRWSVPEWIARNALFFLLPELAQVPEAKPLVEKLADALKHRASFVNVGEFFNSASRKKIWQDAIERADKRIAAENAADWNDPAAYEPFRASFNKLRMIVPT